jgi:hypothetical protein
LFIFNCDDKTIILLTVLCFCSLTCMYFFLLTSSVVDNKTVYSKFMQPLNENK